MKKMINWLRSLLPSKPCKCDDVDDCGCDNGLQEIKGQLKSK